jgi:hypothetical protein
MRRFLPVLIFLAVLVIGYLLLMNPARDSSVKEEKPDISIAAAALYQQFIMDEAFANERYLNKILLVSGKVSTIQTDDRGNISVTFQTEDPAHGVKCRLKSGREYRVGEQLTLKGVCSGYMGDVEMVQCVEQ